MPSAPQPKLLLVTATDKELRAVLGKDANDRVLTLVTGVGIINAALALGKILEQRPIAGVLNLGLAGSFALDTLPLGTICAVNQEIWPEYGLGTDNGTDAKGLQFPLTQLAGKPVWDRLELAPRQAATAMNLALPGAWPHASSLTVSTVSATPARARRLREKYSAQLENMEGFALAYGCARAGIPFLEIRTVSNLVGSREPAHWNLRLALAALGQAARTLLPWLDAERNDG